METEKQTCGWFVFNSGQVLIEKKKTGIIFLTEQNLRLKFPLEVQFIPSAR